jgi:hypothetical protein
MRLLTVAVIMAVLAQTALAAGLGLQQRVSFQPSDARCSIIPGLGRCGQISIKYYFNQRNNICLPYLWGGCGELPPFSTLKECRNVCVPTTSTTTSTTSSTTTSSSSTTATTSSTTTSSLASNRCSLVPNAGFCEAMIPKYFYNVSEGLCRTFIWGGCRGVVPFNSMVDCQATCENQSNATTTTTIPPTTTSATTTSSSSTTTLAESRCKLVPNAGVCEAMIPKYFYNVSEGLCRTFIWGGCQGVVPFNSMQDCQITCEN